MIIAISITAGVFLVLGLILGFFIGFSSAVCLNKNNGTEV